MKKLLAALLLVASTAFAKDNITILYAFSPSDTTGNYSRVLTYEANKIQDKYNFIFDARPGAGGTLALPQGAEARASEEALRRLYPPQPEAQLTLPARLLGRFLDPGLALDGRSLVPHLQGLSGHDEALGDLAGGGHPGPMGRVHANLADCVAHLLGETPEPVSESRP